MTPHAQAAIVRALDALREGIIAAGPGIERPDDRFVTTDAAIYLTVRRTDQARHRSREIQQSDSNSGATEKLVTWMKLCGSGTGNWQAG